MSSSDTCKSCDQLRIHIESAQIENYDEKVKDLTQERKLHVRRPDTMIDDLHKQGKTAKHDILVISYDLQQAMPMPELTVGTTFYKSRLFVYDLGIHDCGDDEGCMYMWSEDDARRGSDKICHIVFELFKKRHNTLIVALSRQKQKLDSNEYMVTANEK
jgi:hypothetical protein